MWTNLCYCVCLSILLLELPFNRMILQHVTFCCDRNKLNRDIFSEICNIYVICSILTSHFIISSRVESFIIMDCCFVFRNHNYFACFLLCSHLSSSPCFIMWNREKITWCSRQGNIPLDFIERPGNVVNKIYFIINIQ